MVQGALRRSGGKVAGAATELGMEPPHALRADGQAGAQTQRDLRGPVPPRGDPRACSHHEGHEDHEGKAGTQGGGVRPREVDPHGLAKSVLRARHALRGLPSEESPGAGSSETAAAAKPAPPTTSPPPFPVLSVPPCLGGSNHPPAHPQSTRSTHAREAVRKTRIVPVPEPHPRA